MNNFLYLTTCIYLIGLIGVLLNRKNIIMVLINVEILTLATSLNYSIFSIYLDDIVGHIFVLFLLTIAAAESAIGLSLVISMFKVKKTISFQAIKKITYKIWLYTLATYFGTKFCNTKLFKPKLAVIKIMQNPNKNALKNYYILDFIFNDKTTPLFK